MVDASPPRKQLSTFIAKYDTKVARIARAALIKMRKRLPGAVALIYDNYNALAIAFGPSERVSEAVLSLALYPRWVSLFFVRGADLPDPKGLLKGAGTRIRHIVLKGAADLDHPDIRVLMKLAMSLAPVRIVPSRRGKLVIKSISARQRPRRVV